MKRAIKANIKKKFFQITGMFNWYSFKYNQESSLYCNNVLNGIVSYNKYGGYFTPASHRDRPAVQKILLGEVYEPDTIAFMRKNCGDGDIVHAGTFFGDFLPALSSAVHEDAVVWAFEPNPESFRFANITLMINNINNVKLIPSGVGEKEANLRMLVQSKEGRNLGGASYIMNTQEKGKAVDVQIKCVDEVVPVNRKISIIQFDVEGFEKEALNGSLNTIRRSRPFLILEDNNKIIDSTWFSNNIASLGYKVVGKIHHNTLLKC